MRSTYVTAGKASWETGRKRDGTARSMAGMDIRSYEVEHPGRPQEAVEEDDGETDVGEGRRGGRADTRVLAGLGRGRRGGVAG